MMSFWIGFSWCGKKVKPPCQHRKPHNRRTDRSLRCNQYYQIQCAHDKNFIVMYFQLLLTDARGFVHPVLDPTRPTSKWPTISLLVAYQGPIFAIAISMGNRQNTPRLLSSLIFSIVLLLI